MIRIFGIDGVEKDLWRLFCPTTLHKQGDLEQVAQDYVQATFEYHQCVLKNLFKASERGGTSRMQHKWLSIYSGSFQVQPSLMVFLLGMSTSTSV